MEQSDKMGEIDTSIVDVASVRLYWQKRSARYALTLSSIDGYMYTHCRSKTLHETSTDHKSTQSEKDRTKVIAPTVLNSGETDHESDEENQIKKKPAKHIQPSHKRSVFKEKLDLTTSNKTKAITPHKYSIPNNSLLFERLERRVGKQVRNRS